MKPLRVGVMYSFIAVVVVGTCANAKQTTLNVAKSIPLTSAPRCLARGSMTTALRALSLGDEADVSRAQDILLKDAAKGPRCRQRVITALIRSMDKPHLNFERDQNAYYLWRYGARLLGDLKASEALDVLISHLKNTDGQFSSSMVHQPALEGVIRMGPIALQKLSGVLHHNTDRDIRRYAVFCICSIGGAKALQLLEEAVVSESDSRVAKFIEFSIISLDNPEHRIIDRAKWFAAFLDSA
jgi:hypothetical protein